MLRKLWIKFAQRGWIIVPPGTGGMANTENLSAYVKEALDVILTGYPLEFSEWLDERGI